MFGAFGDLVEPERGARSAAAQKERPSDERQEVLRLHMPQVGLGRPHKTREKIHPPGRRAYGRTPL